MLKLYTRLLFLSAGNITQGCQEGRGKIVTQQTERVVLQISNYQSISDGSVKWRHNLTCVLIQVIYTFILLTDIFFIWKWESHSINLEFPGFENNLIFIGAFELWLFTSINMFSSAKWSSKQNSVYLGPELIRMKQAQSGLDCLREVQLSNQNQKKANSK